MKRRHSIALSSATTLTIDLALVGASAGTALAGSAVSANRHFTSSNGKDWGNWAKIFTDHGNGHYNDASSAVWPEQGASYEAPPG